MKVRELMAILATLPQEADVLTDGCDCYGDCGGAELDEDGDVMVYRTDGAYIDSRPLKPFRG